MPEGEYETLGGLILDIYEDIPVKGKSILHGKLRFTVDTKLKNRLENIKLEIIHQEKE